MTACAEQTFSIGSANEFPETDELGLAIVPPLAMMGSLRASKPHRKTSSTMNIAVTPKN